MVYIEVALSVFQNGPFENIKGIQNNQGTYSNMSLHSDRIKLSLIRLVIFA